MAPATILRWEDDAGYGPFSARPSIGFTVPALQDMPSPSCDAGIERYPRPDEQCALTEAQVPAFTLAERLRLTQAGQRFRRVTVARLTAIGETQTLFARESRLFIADADPESPSVHE